MSQAIAKSHTPSLSADVLLVTVTKVEALGLLSIIEKERGHECERYYVDHKTYYDLGFIGKARVFMIRSEMGAVGAGGALLTVQAGIKTLSPSAVIMVGIAFGVDPEKQQICDILVSQQLQQYDLQRLGTTPDGEVVITARGERVGASPRLLDRFRDGEMYWEGAKVRFGLLLSGQKLVDNLAFRNNLVKLWPEAIGGEMEGAGLYAAANLSKIEWILVKAICDWADGKKHEHKSQRQKQAAENAANFTIHVIKRGGLGNRSPVQPPSSEPKRLFFELREWKLIHHDVQNLLDEIDQSLKFLTWYKFKKDPDWLEEGLLAWNKLQLSKLKNLPDRWQIQYVDHPSFSYLNEYPILISPLVERLINKISNVDFKKLYLKYNEFREICSSILQTADQNIKILIEEIGTQIGV